MAEPDALIPVTFPTIFYQFEHFETPSVLEKAVIEHKSWKRASRLRKGISAPRGRASEVHFVGWDIGIYDMSGITEEGYVS